MKEDRVREARMYEVPKEPAMHEHEHEHEHQHAGAGGTTALVSYLHRSKNRRKDDSCENFSFVFNHVLFFPVGYTSRISVTSRLG